MGYKLAASNGDTLAVPQLVLTHLTQTDGDTIRAALYILQTHDTDPRTMARALALPSIEAAKRTLQYWAGAGLLVSERGAAPAPAAEPARVDLASVANDPYVAVLCQEAQSIFGKTLSRSEMQRLVGLYLNDGWQPSQYAKLAAGKQYAVYSAPSDTSFRAANGKALLSTNDWVQVFFEEDGYLLVQYAISRHQYRIGYIKADAVSNLSEVAEIGSWANYPAQVLRTSALTDDPLNSCGAVMTLKAGQQVTYLGQLGQEWAFVETTTAQGQRIRGFVELSELNVTRPDDADDNLNG